MNGKASASAVSSLQSQVNSEAGELNVLQTQVNNLSTTVNGKASSSAVTALTNQVNHSETGLVALNSDITSLGTTVNGKASTSSVSTLSDRVTVTEGSISTIQSAGYVLSSEVGGVVATATNQLTQRVTAVEGDVATIEQQYTVGLDNNGTFTGFEIINGSDVNTFTVTSDDFKIKTSGGSKTPFAVSGNTVTLSNTQVTGNLNVGVGGSGARTEITDDGIKIYDGSGLRVKIGAL